MHDMIRYETVFGMQSDREKIAGDLITSEMAFRRLKRQHLADLTLTSVATIAKAKNGDMSEVTRVAIELAFGWPDGFLEAVLIGDLEKVQAYPITPKFREYIRATAVERLRQVQMLLPVIDEDAESNGV